jgi:hypothetical protein
MIYLLTAIGLTSGGSGTVHIYTQTIHRTTQLTKKQHKQQIWKIICLLITHTVLIHTYDNCAHKMTPLQSSIFRKISIQNVFKLMCDYIVKPHFPDDELGETFHLIHG